MFSYVYASAKVLATSKRVRKSDGALAPRTGVSNPVTKKYAGKTDMLKAEILTKCGIRSYEEEVGVRWPAPRQQVFHQVYHTHLIHTTLGEMTFRKILQHA